MLNIYVDMDGVVADWNAFVFQHLGRHRAGWDDMKHYPRIYRDLPLKEGATELIAWLYEYQQNHEVFLAFLTAIPSNHHMPWAVQDKVDWARRHWPSMPVFIGPYARDKQAHCQAGDILLDDKWLNCEQWQQAGGRSHQYRDWTQAKIWLEQTLL
jgi:hypothetical protein